MRDSKRTTLVVFTAVALIGCPESGASLTTHDAVTNTDAGSQRTTGRDAGRSGGSQSDAAVMHVLDAGQRVLDAGAGRAGAGGSGTGAGGGGAVGGSVGAQGPSDTAPVGHDFQIWFPSMYSGFDGVHVFKIPAAVQNMSGLRWSASDASLVDLSADPSTGGVMITTKQAGTVQIIARQGNLSSSAPLVITAYSALDCDAGDMRYNSGPGVDGGTASLIQSLNSVDKRAACQACHGDGAQFLSVKHTPQQTGGWTDQELQQIITDGSKPDGSVFVTMVPPQIYQSFHRWQVTDQEQVGVVCYMRSIAPKGLGMLDFGGFSTPLPLGSGGNTGTGSGGVSGGGGRGGTSGTAVACGSGTCPDGLDPQGAPACCADPVSATCGRIVSGLCVPRSVAPDAGH